MKNCCGIDIENICSQLECNIKETKDGIQMDIRPKDSTKVESLMCLMISSLNLNPGEISVASKKCVMLVLSMNVLMDIVLLMEYVKDMLQFHNLESP